MLLNKKKLYIILFFSCFIGCLWLYISYNFIKTNLAGVCLIKNITGIPCPSCGSTRSVVSLIKGDFYNALKINPLGYVIAAIMILTPLWILTDIVSKKESLFNFYNKTEAYLKNPKFAIPLVMLLLINWIWSISKGL